MTITPIGAGSGAGRNGDGTSAPGYPSGGSAPAADDLLLHFQAAKPTSTDFTFTDSGWAELVDTTGGTGAHGADTGPMRGWISHKTHNDSDTALNISVTGSPNPSVGLVANFRKTVSGAWDLAATGGDDSTGNAGGAAGGLTATMASAISIASGDQLVAVFGVPMDTAVLSAYSITVPGCTVGAASVVGAFDSNLGSDAQILVVTAAVTAGTSSGAATVTATSSLANGTAGVLLLARLREPSAGTSAPAGNAAGTGAANAASVQAKPNAGHAAGTGAANVASSKVNPSSGNAAGTGAALAATGTTTSTAGAATGTGSAGQGVASLAPNAGAATGTGSAYDATVTTATATSAPAGVATGTGAAGQGTASLALNAGAATGTGSAFDATAFGGISVSAGNAAGTGSAFAGSPLVVVNASAATGTGSAFDATATTATTTSANAGNAAGTGSAFDGSAKVNPTSGAATGTGAALVAGLKVIPNAGNASGTGSAFDGSSKVNPTAGHAAGSGSAFNATAFPAMFGAAGVATGTGAASSATTSVKASAGVAEGSGAAYGATEAGAPPVVDETPTGTAGELGGGGRIGQFGRLPIRHSQGSSRVVRKIRITQYGTVQASSRMQRALSVKFDGGCHGAVVPFRVGLRSTGLLHATTRTALVGCTRTAGGRVSGRTRMGVAASHTTEQRFISKEDRLIEDQNLIFAAMEYLKTSTPS